MDKLISIIDKSKKWSKYAIAWLAIASTITFMLFILEEAYQTASFAAYYANSARQYDSLPATIKTCKSIRTVGLAINYAIGWINPLSFVAFNSFFNVAAPAQIAGMESLLEKAVKNIPEVVEEELRVFKVTTSANAATAYTLEGYRVVAFSDNPEAYKLVASLEKRVVRVKGPVSEYASTKCIYVDFVEQVEVLQ